MTFTMMACDAELVELAVLRKRVAELEAENCRLKELLRPGIVLPPSWHLTPAEQNILLSLFSAPMGFRSIDVLREEFCRPGSAKQTIATLVSQLRKKIEARGMAINSIRDRGYELTTGSREIVARAIQEVREACEPLIESGAA